MPDDDKPRWVKRVPANDNSQKDPSVLDARLLGHMLDLLSATATRKHGIAAHILFDTLQLREPRISADFIRSALHDARLTGFIILRDKRLYIARGVSAEQVECVRTLIGIICQRGRK